jgi:hypothetical protein
LPKSRDPLIIQTMTCLVRYLTHPQVRIDPAVPIPAWSLSSVGRARAEVLANKGSFLDTTQIIASGERKAIETAEIIAAKLNIDLEVREAMHENDRSATGFLAPEEFEPSPTDSSRNHLRAFGGGSERSTRSCALSRRSNTCSLGINLATSSLSGTVPSGLFCFAIIPALRSIGPTTNLRAEAMVLHSPKRDVAFCTSGVVLKICDLRLR